MGIDLKNIAGKFGEVASSVTNPLILMLMGYISNALMLLYGQGASNPIIYKSVRILSFGVREFEAELKDVVAKSPTPYDDKLVDELLEVIDEVLGEGDDDQQDTNEESETTETPG